MLRVGCNPNAIESWGATPLTIAVLMGNKELCQLLISSGLRVRETLYVNVPLPLAISEKMELTEIYELIQQLLSEDEDDAVGCYDTDFLKSRCNSYKNADNIEINLSSPYHITGVVGDIGTCEDNGSVMTRLSAYSWVGVIPGGLHTKWDLVEACFKKQEPGGFRYLVNN